MSEQIERAYSQIENIAETLKSFKKTIEQYLNSLQQEITRSQLFVNTIGICKENYVDTKIHMEYMDLLTRAQQHHKELEDCQAKPTQYLSEIQSYLKSFDQCQWFSKLRQLENSPLDKPEHQQELAQKITQLDNLEKELKAFFIEMDLNLEAQNQALIKLRQSYQVLDDRLFSLINPSHEASSQRQ